MQAGPFPRTARRPRVHPAVPAGCTRAVRRPAAAGRPSAAARRPSPWRSRWHRNRVRLLRLRSYNYEYEVLTRYAERGKVKAGITITNGTTSNSSIHPPFQREEWDKYIGGPLNALVDKFDSPLRTKKQKAIGEEELAAP
ncbi:hypothetical protein [Streptomyces sp. NPDC050856]|uniref:hypothetical protein n=1 Tax=Streptomyces sp. NPDC050856 TaxID=3154939 RepID=UPI0033F2EACE